ncbi:putative ribosomal protein L16 [Helianthus debilis subsp. tardiflorus]
MKSSKYRKGRCSRGCKPDGTRLGFGRYGTKSCRAGNLSYQAIEVAHRARIGQFHRNMSGHFRINGKKSEWEEEKEILRVGLLVCPQDKSHLKWMM